MSDLKSKLDGYLDLRAAGERAYQEQRDALGQVRSAILDLVRPHLSLMASRLPDGRRGVRAYDGRWTLYDDGTLEPPDTSPEELSRGLAEFFDRQARGNLERRGHELAARAALLRGIAGAIYGAFAEFSDRRKR